jgi:hypothetical protein
MKLMERKQPTLKESISFVRLEADAANLRLANHLLQRGEPVLRDAAGLNGSW